jgi:hypothetical protein
MVCDEKGIGGGGDYCGDNDAQFTKSTNVKFEFDIHKRPKKVLTLLLEPRIRPIWKRRGDIPPSLV